MKKLLFYAIFLCLSSLSIFAQNTPAKGLKGLHVAGPNEIKPGTPLMLNPAETPIYDENFERLS